MPHRAARIRELVLGSAAERTDIMETKGTLDRFLQPPRGAAPALALALVLPPIVWASTRSPLLAISAAVLSVVLLYLLWKTTTVVYLTSRGVSLFLPGRGSYCARLATLLPQHEWRHVARVRTDLSWCLHEGPLDFAHGTLTLELPGAEVRLSLRARIMRLVFVHLAREYPAAESEGALSGWEVEETGFAAARRHSFHGNLFYRAALRYEELLRRPRPDIGAGDRRDEELLLAGYRSLLGLRLKRAERCFAEALTLLPEDDRLRSDYIDILWTLGRLPQAHAQLSWLCRRNPLDPNLWARLGDLSDRRGDETSAVRAWRRAVTCGDPAGEAGLAIALHHLRRGELGEARAILLGTLERTVFPLERENLREIVRRLEAGESLESSVTDLEERVGAYLFWGRVVGIVFIYLFLITYVMGAAPTTAWGGMGAGFTLYVLTNLLSRFHRHP